MTLSPGTLGARLWDWLRGAMCAVFVACVALVAVRTWHWPLVNDASQISYVTFLMDHGMAPYRDILEMNQPGILLINWAVRHTLGDSALAWRIFDFGLMGVATTAILVIAWPCDWFAGVFASALFILFHARDGAAQLGQRDLIVAVLLLGACAFLFHALRLLPAQERVARDAPVARPERSWRSACMSLAAFGVCGGMASTIKPTPLPFAVLLLLLAIAALKRRNQPTLLPAASAVAGLLAPLLLVLLYLQRQHALSAFLRIEATALPYYAALGRRGLVSLLVGSMSPSMWGIAALALLVAAARHDWRRPTRPLPLWLLDRRLLLDHRWEHLVLIIGIAFGIASYMAQGRGYAYHRYPLLGFLLCEAAIVFAAALRRPAGPRPRLVRSLGTTGLLLGGLLAPVYAAQALRAPWNPQFNSSLEADLTVLNQKAISASRAANPLSNRIQCLYTFSECDTALYRLGLVQSTGLIYDFFLFGPASNPVVQHMRADFSRGILRNPPEVFVVLTGLYPNGPPGYGKLALWPWFDDYLAANYSIYAERSSITGTNFPLGYRIYLRKPNPAARA